MKKTTQRILSLFMSAVMTVSALSLANFSSYAEVSDSSTEEAVDNSDTELKYGGIFGSLLGDEINDSIQGNEEEQNRDYTVYRITHDPEKAYVGVDYHALTECTLFVGFYDDEGTQLVSSITTDLEEAANGHVDLTVLDVLPDYYLIKAFIVGKQFREPLSKPAVYNKQTKIMQEILGTTIEYFEEEEETVVNLDKNINNNFVVLQDGVNDITPTETTDIYKGEDESGNYKFENAVEIAKLKKGDKAFVRSSPQMVAFVIDDIIIDGTDAVITPVADADAGALFKFIKMDSSEYTGETKSIVNEDENSNVEYVEETNTPYPRPLVPDNNDPYALNYPSVDSLDSGEIKDTISKNYHFKLKFTPDEVSSANVDENIFGEVTIGIELKYEIYYDIGYFGLLDSYLSVNMELTDDTEIVIGFEAENEVFELPGITLLLGEGVISISINPVVTLSLEAQFHIEYIRKFSFSYTLGLVPSYITYDPEVLDIGGSAIVTLRLGAECGLKVLCFEVLKLMPYIGMEFDISDTDYKYNYQEKNHDYFIHSCRTCMTIERSFIIGAELSVGALGFEREWDWHYTWNTKTYHYNDTDKFKEGPCENYSHKIAFTVKSEKTGKPISSVKFYSVSNNGQNLKTYSNGSAITTDTDGKASFWESDSVLTDETYRVLAVAPSGESAYLNVGKMFDPDAKKQYTFPIKIFLKNEITSSTDPDDEDKEKKYDNNSEYVEDAHPIFWLGYDSSDDVFMQVFPETETAYIYGEGLLSYDKYQKQVDSKYKNKIKKLIFLGDGVKLSNNDYHVYFNSFADEGEPYGNIEYIDISSLNIEKLPNNLFNNCQKLKEVKLPDSLKRLGDYAFGWCKSLEYINLPVNLEIIDYQAFQGSGLKKIDCPSSLLNIETFAFYDCNNLSEINLNYGLQLIGNSALAYTNIKNLNIPETVKIIGRYICDEGVGYSYSQLKTLIINSDYVGFYVDPYDGVTKYTIESDYFFPNLKRLERVILNEGVTKIVDECFMGCENLREISFPKSLKRIGKYAFQGTALTSVVIPENVEFIGEYPFPTDKIRDITILNPDCEIQSYIGVMGPDYGPDLIIRGYRNSTAEAYAKRMNNTFIPLDPVENETTTVTTSSITTTTTTTTVTAVAATVIAPDSECVFMIVNEDKAVPDEADKLLDESNLYYFDQETADENGNVKFGYVPDNTVDRLFIFISEVVNGSIKEISRSVGKPGDMKTTVYTQPVPTKEENVVFGDTNGDGEIDMSDAVLIMQSISNPNKYGMNGTAAVHMTEAGKKNADVYDPGSGVTSMDALTIQRYLMGIHTTLPVYKNS